MEVKIKYDSLLADLPELLPSDLTFMEIAGFPHYENVCSNILRFYFNPKTKLHGLDDLLLKSLLQAAGKDQTPFNDSRNLHVKREVVTNAGRIDLLLFTDKWVIGIENKIRHHLNNDLDEYAAFIAKEFEGKEITKFVLSLRTEGGQLAGGFVNITYKALIEKVEANLAIYQGNKSDQYFIFFTNFLQTIKKLYMPVIMEKIEIQYLINNQDKIEQLIALENKFANYIDQRANKIINSINLGANYEKWVYNRYDPGFHYRNGDLYYKLECPIEKQGMSIVICVEPNKADREVLKKLDFFKKNDIANYKNNVDNSRVILEEGIDFFTSDDIIIEKLKKYLAGFKITEINEQLN